MLVESLQATWNSALAVVVAIVAIVLGIWWRSSGGREASGKPADATKDGHRPISQHMSFYSPHLDETIVQAGLADGSLGKGTLSIYKAGRDKAWVRGIHGMQRDLFLDGERSRNRALEGDIVAVDRKRNEVVGIMERRHRTEIVGVLRVVNRAPQRIEKGGGKGNSVELEFLPNDNRFPLMSIPRQVVKCCAEAQAMTFRHSSKDMSCASHFSQISSQKRACLVTRLKLFVDGPQSTQLHLEPTLSSLERNFVHTMAKELGLDSQSFGEGRARHIVISRTNGRSSTGPVAHALNAESDAQKSLETIANRKQEGTFERLFVATIAPDWEPHHRRPHASALRCLGMCDDLDVHLRAITVEHEIHNEQPADEVLSECSCFMQDGDLTHDASAGRRDFREHTVFSIDPASARDLDDALHSIVGEDGNTEVGIHIADASHWVKEGGALDVHAQARCTSTYLTMFMCPMLPRQLSENKCSLTGGRDRLTFSIVVRLSPNGEVLNEPWFGRGIIRCRGKLSYEEAEAALSASTFDEATEVCEGAKELVLKEDPAKIARSLQELARVARILKTRTSKRAASSSIRPSFQVDADTGVVSLDQGDDGTDLAKQAHSLVEEFMLLANRLVAEKMASRIPSRVLLRSQAVPHQDRLRAWAAQCSDHAASVSDINWAELEASQLGEAVQKLEEAASEVEESNAPRAAGLRALAVRASRTMSSAQYVSGISDSSSHFSLGMSEYTHFTSPIRRYADLLVHRELAKLIEGRSAPDADTAARESMQAVLSKVNARVLHAKWAQQESNDLFLARWMQQQGPVTMSAVVLDIGKNSLTVLVARLGLEAQCRYDDVIGCTRHSAEAGRGTQGDGGRLTVVSLYSANKAGDASLESEGEECMAVLRELDVVAVRLCGKLGRRVVIKAQLLLTCPTQPDGASQAPAEQEKEEMIPEAPELARQASRELRRTLSCKSSDGDD